LRLDASLTVSFPPVAHTHNLDGSITGLSKDKAPVAYSKAVLRRINVFQLLHIASIREQKSGQSLKKP
jgi:hypothetical protein